MDLSLVAGRLYARGRRIGCANKLEKSVNSVVGSFNKEQTTSEGCEYDEGGADASLLSPV